MKRWLLVLLWVVLAPVTVAQADDDPMTPWPVVERCVAAPTLMPSDWTYSGALLMSGYAGIHAMQADWETPRVVASFYRDELGEPIDGGQLSPDGRWYAAPIGEMTLTASLNQYYTTNGLRIYSTVDERELNFNLSDYDNLLDYDRSAYYGAVNWVYQAVRWLDNEALIIGSFEIRPFDNEVAESPIAIAEAFFADFEVAPDWTRVYGFISSSQGGEGVFDPDFPDVAIAYLDTEAVAWLHNSSGFVALQNDESEMRLSLYNRDGEFVELLYLTEDESIEIDHPIAGRNELGWSPDDAYFAFEATILEPRSRRLYLIDFEQAQVIDTCLEPASRPVWSPDGMQVAYLARGPESMEIIIFDMARWEAYIVGWHSAAGGVFGPGMVGWRE